MDTNIVGNNTTGITAATDTFLIISGAGAGSSSTQISASENVMPIAGTFKNFYIMCDAGPGVGLSRTFTIYKNGSDTSMTLTLSGAGTGAGVSTGNDTTHTVSFSAGDLISIHTTATGTSTSTGTIRWTIDANSSTSNRSMILATSANAMSATLTNYIVVQGKGVDNTAGTNSQGVMPTAGTLKNAYLMLSGTPGASASYVATLVQNGSPTSIVVTISGAATTGNDLTHSVSVSPGDTLYWSIVPSIPTAPTARTVTLSLEFDPTTNGESIHIYGSSIADVSGAVRFNTVVSPNEASYQSTETSRQVLSQAAVWQKLYVNLLTAPGAGASYQTQVSANSVAGNPSVTISGLNTTGNDTSGNVTTTVGQTIAIKMTPTTAPVASTIGFGVVSYIAPSLTSSSAANLMMMGV